MFPDRGPGGGIILFKSVNPKTRCDYHTGKIKYEGEVVCPDWKDDDKQQCGNGLHLSPSADEALIYHQGLVLRCEVAFDDFVVYSEDITKVRCKKVTVLEEVT